MKNFPFSADSNTYRKQLLGVLLLLLTVLLISTILLALVPPISRDALTHHLFVPKLYLKNGGIYEIPDIPFSYYPMNLDLLYTAVLYFGNDILPKYVHYIFALLTAGLIFNYLKTRLSIVYGLFGSIFFLSIPVIVKLSITVYVDLGLMFFVTASLLFLLRWVNSDFKMSCLILAGICCGLAAGVKYNGLISLFLLPLFVPIIYIRTQREKRASSINAISYGVVFLVFALLFFSPWLIRNYNWTGNPIYPLHNSLFQSARSVDTLTAHDKIEKNENDLVEAAKKVKSHRGSVFAFRKAAYGEKWWQTLLLPVRYFFEGRDDSPRYFDGKLTPFLLLLTLFAFNKNSPTFHFHREKLTLLVFAVLFFFFSFLLEPLRIRYIVPIVPSLVILSMFGMHNIVSTISETKIGFSRQFRKIILAAVTGGMLLYNAGYIIDQFQYVKPLQYLSGKIDRKQYISIFRPEFPVIQHTNSIVTEDAKVLCLFIGNRGYYMDFIPIFENPFQNGILKKILSQQDLKVSMIKSIFLDMEIKHILLRHDLTQTWLAGLPKEKQSIVANFFSNETTLLNGNDRYSIYELEL